MFATTSQALRLLGRKNRTKYYLLITSRALAGLFDLVAVLLLGALVSLIAIYSSASGAAAAGIISVFSGPGEIIPSRELVISIAGMTIFLFILKALVSAVLTKKTASFLAECEIRASGKLLRDISEKKLKDLNLMSDADLIFSVKQGTHAAFGGLLQNFATLIAESFLFLCLAIVFFYVSPATTGVLLLAMAMIGALLHFYIGRRIQENSKKATYSSPQIDNGITTFISGFREIYSAGKQEIFLSRISRSRDLFARVEANQIFLQAMPRYIIETSVILLILSMGLIQVVDVDINKTASTLGVFMAGGMRIVAAMVPLQAALGQLRHYVPEANEAMGLFTKMKIHLIDANIQKIQNPGIQAAGKAVGARLSQVGFKYSNRRNFALENIDIEIPVGKMVALIGKSGSGKSTIADLIIGLLDPSKGQVSINGTPASTYVEKNPGSIGYVSQKPIKFPGTILENVALGYDLQTADSERALAALDSANLKEFAESQSNGLHTDITHTKLSGGQLQRLGLARALYAEPKLLLLDEVTASLDAESERAIRSTLEKLRGQVSLFVIAHRIETIKKADVIYILEDGHIVEFGTFDELDSSGNKLKKYLN